MESLIQNLNWIWDKTEKSLELNIKVIAKGIDIKIRTDNIVHHIT